MEILPFFLWLGVIFFGLWAFAGRDGDPATNTTSTLRALLVGVVVAVVGGLLLLADLGTPVVIVGAIAAIIGGLITFACLLSLLVNALPEPPWRKPAPDARKPRR